MLLFTHPSASIHMCMYQTLEVSCRREEKNLQQVVAFCTRHSADPGGIADAVVMLPRFFFHMLRGPLLGPILQVESLQALRVWI